MKHQMQTWGLDNEMSKLRQLGISEDEISYLVFMKSKQLISRKWRN